MNFASDNIAAAHPRIMQALVAANAGVAPSYGSDPATCELTLRLREVFEAPRAEVVLVPTGTAANALALSLYAPGWGRILCHEDAHIIESEAGASEFFTGGAKLRPIAGAGGKLTRAGLQEALGRFDPADLKAGQISALSLTNATEAGTVYTPAEIRELASLARDAGLAVHLDGARFANALAATGAAPADLSWRAGVDILSFGATKNGCVGVEALVLFDASRAQELRFRQMRSGHQLSKHRFLSAQLLAYLQDGLWLDLARHANAMAAELGQGLAALPGVTINQPVQTNAVFATLPEAMAARVRAAGASFHPWAFTPDAPGHVSVRLVTSWATEPAEIAGFLAACRAG